VSRGPGRIERAIRALFDANPDLAFITDEVAEHCFPGVPMERKHRVSVLRAAWKVVAPDPNWTAWIIEGQGSGLVFLNQDSIRSTAAARLIVTSKYRSPKRARRIYGEWVRIPGARVKRYLYPGDVFENRADLMAQVGDGGGSIDAVLWHRASRDGNTLLLQHLARRQQAEAPRWGKRFQAGDVTGEATIIPPSQYTQLADRARALMVENDPDAVRAGLAELARALEEMG
jgi:hypothetical protein